MKERREISERQASEGRTAEEMLSKLRSGVDLRQDKVRRLRRAIRLRTYENDLKLTIALERLWRVTGSDDRG